MHRAILGSLLALGMLAGVAAAAPFSSGSAPEPPRRSEQAWKWLAARRAEAVILLNKGNKARLRAQLAEWRSISARLAREDGITGEAGYVIYPPPTSLALLLLDRASSIYRAALAGELPESLPGLAELRRLAGEQLRPTEERKYPSVARVRAALETLAIPADALRGYRVYLLPFALGDLSGQGGPGFAILAAEPLREELIPNQLEVTLAHEFGHHLHLAAMPRDSAAGRRLWAEYLSLRGLEWREDGPVNTSAWAGSPEETLAEDFRILCGGPGAREEPAATAAGDPRDRPATVARLRSFLLHLAERAGSIPNMPPWPEGEAIPDRDGLLGLGSLSVLVLSGVILLAGSRGGGRTTAPSDRSGLDIR